MAGQTVLKVKADARLRVQAELPQRLAGGVAVGAPIRATINGERFDSVVTSVFPFVEGSTRSFRIEAIVANPGHAIQPGSFAEVEIVTSTPVTSLSVRREAVKTAGDGTNYVWVLKVGQKVADKDAIYTCTMHPQIEQRGPGACPICGMALVRKDARGNLRVEKRAVKVGARDSMNVAILDGIADGEEVTCFGDGELFPGASVKVVEWGKHDLVPGTGDGHMADEHAGAGREPRDGAHQ